MQVRYRSPSYRTDLVAHRYVRRLCDDRGNLTDMYRVYECAVYNARKHNTDDKLSGFKVGPTLREYDLTVRELPTMVIERIGRSRATWVWSL